MKYRQLQVGDVWRRRGTDGRIAIIRHPAYESPSARVEYTYTASRHTTGMSARRFLEQFEPVLGPTSDPIPITRLLSDIESGRVRTPLALRVATGGSAFHQLLSITAEAEQRYAVHIGRRWPSVAGARNDGGVYFLHPDAEVEIRQVNTIADPAHPPTDTSTHIVGYG